MTRTTALAGLCLIVALSALAAAYGSERFGGLVPCALCLVERWPWWAAAACALLALAVRRRAALWLVVACMAASVAAAGVHVGVEQGWWPSPLPECAAPRLSGSMAQRLAAMPDTPSKPCDDPTYLVPGVPVSMAAGDGLLALALGGVLAICLLRAPASMPARAARRTA